jgi:hypothetical protein
MDLTDLWTIIEPLFEEKRRPDGRGCPWRDARAVIARSVIRYVARETYRAILRYTGPAPGL